MRKLSKCISIPALTVLVALLTLPVLTHGTLSRTDDSLSAQPLSRDDLIVDADPRARRGGPPRSNDVLVSLGLADTNYTASGTHESFLPAQAFDGEWNDPLRYWNAGGFPVQWIEVDLGQRFQLTRLWMVTAMLPEGPTRHEVWGSDRPMGASTAHGTLLGVLEGPTTDQERLEVSLSPRPWARYVQVRTTATPSWVAWMEIQVYAVRPS